MGERRSSLETVAEIDALLTPFDNITYGDFNADVTAYFTQKDFDAWRIHKMM